MGGAGAKAKGASLSTVSKPVQLALPSKSNENIVEEEEEEDDEEEEVMDEGKTIESKEGKKVATNEEDRPSLSSSTGEDEPKSSKEASNDQTHDSKSSSAAALEQDSPTTKTVATAYSPATKVTMKIESSAEKKKKKNAESSSSASVSSAIKAAGIDTGSSKSRGANFSISSVLSARATEAYNEEKMKDPQFSMWVPPVNQSGDGKTKLNEKYGY